MAPFSWSRWLRSLLQRPKVSPVRRPRGGRPALETLEDRLAPAKFYWTGAGPDANWSDPQNWLNQTGQQATPNPDGGDDLVFQDGAAQHFTFNDLLNSQGGMASFNSLTFSNSVDGTGYTLSGNPINLGTADQSGTTNDLNVNTNVNPVDIQLDVTLAGSNTNGVQLVNVFTIGAGSVVTLDGHLSGSDGKLVKEGFGTLTLTNDNSGASGAANPFDDAITIDTNGGIIQITNPNALGDAPAPDYLHPFASPNIVTVQANGQLQVNNVGNVGGPVQQTIILNGPGPIADGALLNVQGTNHWTGSVILDADSTVGSNLGNLYIDGVISDNANAHNLTKEGDGEVTFTNANTYRGQTVINNGVLDVQNAQALGAADDTFATGTVVNENISARKFGTLQIDDPNAATDGGGFTIDQEQLTINGAGGAEVQTVTVSGPAGGSFTLTFKGFTTAAIPVGASATQVQNALDALPSVNFPRGFVTVQATPVGSSIVYTVEFLGNSVAAGNLHTLGQSDQPQMTSAVAGGATAVVNTIRDGDAGALHNLNGNNTWTGDVIVGSKTPDNKAAVIGVAEATTLTVTGFVETANSPTGLTKDQPGTLIFTADNAGGVTGHPAFTGGVTLPFDGATVTGGEVAGGILQIQDSQALGTAATGWTVLDGASLAFAIDSLPDSVTGTTNTLLVSNPLSIAGQGASVLGALVSISGINQYVGQLTLGNFSNTAVASIGVLPDPNPSSDQSYITNDYSLTIGQAPAAGTVSGGFINSEAGTVGSALTWFKFGGGNLILPSINPNLHSQADIEQGWVTAQASGLAFDPTLPGETSPTLPATSLGRQMRLGDLPGTASVYTPAPPLDQNLQRTVTVEEGAALHLDPLSGNLDILQNLVLKGQGISHPFGLINDQGALENLNGFNTVHGDVTLQGQDGIGVEQVFGSSQLVMTGSTNDAALVKNVAARSSGSGNQEVDNVFNAGGTSGTLQLTYNMYGNPDSIDVYYGVKGQGGVLLYTSNGLVSGVQTLTLPFSPTVGASFSQIEVIMDQGGVPSQLNTQWFFTAAITPTIPVAGGITKVGSKLLALQGDGTYVGPVDIRQGVLLDQNDTGLGAGGAATSVTTVESGAALALANGEQLNGVAPQPTGVVPSGNALTIPGEFTNANGIAYNNGGIQTGIEVWGEHLILNGPGNTTIGQKLAAFNVLSDGSLTVPPGGSGQSIPIITSDDAWRGPITLQTSTSVNVEGDSRLILSGAIDDAMNPLALGSDLLKVGQGEVVLVGANTYRGTTYVGSGPITGSTLGDAPTAEVQQIEVFGNAADPVTGLPGFFTLSVTGPNGTVTSNSMPLGDTAADVQAQVTALLAQAGFATGTVSVVQTGSFYYVTLGGALAGAVPDITATGANGTLTFDNSNVLPMLSVGGVASTYYTGVTGSPVMGGVVTAANSQALGSTLGGTIVQTNSALQTEGNITVAGEPLTLAGSGVPATPGPAPTQPPATWLSEGPAPNVMGPTLGNPAPVSGRVTGITVDPTDPNTIYLATAGGGAWKTSNGGKTWQPMFDLMPESAESTTAPMFIGAVALDPNNPLHVFLGTGEAHNSTDSYYGTGMYQSFDGGVTWSQMLGITTYGVPSVVTNASGTPIQVIRTPATFTAGTNPFFGRAISSIQAASDPNTGQLVVFVASSDQASNSPTVNGGNAGIWRWCVDPKSGALGWFCMTDVTSDVRFADLTGLANPTGFPSTTVGPDTPGPDDDWNLSFSGGPNSPNTGVWSQLQLIVDPTSQLPNAPHIDLFASFADPFGNASNGLYHCTNPFPSEFAVGAGGFGQVTNPAEPADVPLWYIGNENTDPLNNTYSRGGASPFPTPAALTHLFAGNIKFWGVNGILYAATASTVPTPPGFPVPTGQVQGLLDIWQGTATIGQGWQFAQIPSTPTNYMGTQGFYDNAVFFDGTNLFVGGENAVYKTANAGATWVNVTTDVFGNAPAADVQVFFPGTNPQGNADLLTGTDGGIWSYDRSSSQPTSAQWFNLNTTLAISQANSVAIVPSNPAIAYVSTQSGGTSKFTNGQGWTSVDFTGLDNTGAVARAAYGAAVAVDPNNPNTIYAWVDTSEVAPQGEVIPAATLRKSTDGGVTWSNVFTPPGQWNLITSTYLNNGGQVGLTDNPILLVDPVNSSRVLIGGHGGQTGTLWESLAGGATGTWFDISSPGALPFGTVSAMAIAAYQGPFVLDPSFLQVGDIGINSYDPNTIYVTNGTTVAVTKNHGNTWASVGRTPPGMRQISDLEVDPNDRDIVFATDSSPVGSGTNRLMVSTNAGRSWVSLDGSGTTGLPDVPVWKVQLDPRDGHLYVGTDKGVFFSTDGGSTWSTFGLGLPNVQVKDIVLDQALNSLTVATYGRGVFVAYLNQTRAQAGALNSVGGTDVWGGKVQLSGPANIGATGVSPTGFSPFGINGLTQAPQVASLAAQLNITGVVSDLVPNANSFLTKVGAGNVYLSGNNTYGGTTEVQQGALIVDNSHALGGTGVSEVQTLDLSGLTVGESFNLTFDGITTATPITFSGVDQTDAGNVQSALQALSSVTSQGGQITVTPTGTPGVFTVTFGGNMTGFQQGMISGAPVANGTGVPAVTETQAGAGGTIVDAGQELGLQSDLAGESIQLNGSGFNYNGHAQGAFRSLSNVNTFTGKLILETDATVGVDSNSVLTVAGPGTIVDNNNGFNLIKELAGTLVLASPNSYGGTGTFNVPDDPGASFAHGTVVAQGAIDVENGQALGRNNNTTTVLVGAQVQMQGGVTVNNQNLRLSGTGINATGALEGVGGANHWTGPVTLATDPGFNPTTAKPVNVALGSLLSNAGDNLFVDGPIGQASPFLGVTKVDAGVVTLAGTNTYTGLTNVAAGSLRVASAGALGNPGTSSTQAVLVNAPLPGQQFSLSFNGASTIPLSANPITPAATLKADLNALPTINGAVTNVSLANNIYTITFGGSLGAGNTPLLVATASPGTGGGAAPIITVTSDGTVVQPGAALEMDLDEGNNPVAVPTEGLTLNGTGTPDVQVVTVTGSAGAFFLGFNGQTTKTGLPFNASASQVQAALNALSSIGGTTGGSVSVSRTALPGGNGFSYVILFAGSLGGIDLPQMTASGTGGATATTTVFRHGGGGALRDLAGNNSWAGPVILQTNSSVGADPGATLTLSGTVEDVAAPTGPAAPALTKVGYGIVVLPGANTYSGPTSVAQGILNIQNNQALGGVVNEVQTVALNGSLTGHFTLTFRGATTQPTNPGLSSNTSSTNPGFLATVQAALNALPTIGGVGGFVTVNFVPGNQNSFTVTFGGSLANQHLPVMTATANTGATASVSITTDGSNGTTVTPGGTLQMQGGITVSTEGLTLSGTGTSAVQQFSTTGGPFTLTFNGQTAVLPAGATQDQVAAALNALSSVGGVGGSALVSQVAGVNVTPIPATGTVTSQQVAVIGTADLGFSLTVNGQTTAVLPFGATPDQVAAALGALSTVGAGNVTVTGVNNLYTVTFTGTAATAGQPAVSGSGVYDVVFGGSFANQPVPLMTATGVGPNVAVSYDPGDPTNNTQDFTVTGAPGGGFTLTFNGQTTQPIPVGASAAQVQTALNALPGIGGSNGVTVVTLVNGVYVVNFNGSLAGTQFPLMQGTGQVITTSLGGAGALNSATGVNTWHATNPTANPVQLAGNTWLGAESDLSTVVPTPAVLNIAQGISTAQGATTTNVTKVDSGTVQFSGVGANTYNGTTTVDDGVLQLNNMGVGATVAVTPNMTSGKVTSQTVTVTPNGGSSFTLTVNGQTTAAIPVGATAMQVQVALAALPSIQFTTNVNVTGSPGGPYTVAFTGTAAPSGVQPAITGAGVFAIPGTVTVGDNNPTPPNALSDVLQLLASNQMPAATIVNVMPDGLFDLNGFQQTIGALNMTAGTVSITNPGSQLTLTGNVTVTVAADAINPKNQDVTVVGVPGGNFALTFGGETTQPIPYGATAAQVQAALNALPNIGVGGSTVTLTNGVYVVKFNGTLGNSVQPLMSGTGQIINAGSDSFGDPASIQNLNGGGTLLLTGPGATDFNVAGPTALYADLVVSAIVSASGPISKTGPGTLALTSDNPNLTGTTTINQGEVLADGDPAGGSTLGLVTLAGGTLGGNGTVGTVTSAPIGGTLMGGDGLPIPPSILNINAPPSARVSNLNANTNFNVVLYHAGNGPNSQVTLTAVDANGNPDPTYTGSLMNLGNAVLTGTLDPAITVNPPESFIILTTTNPIWTITGQFAFSHLDPVNGLPVVFINGQKFDISYEDSLGNVVGPNNGVNQVVLTRVTDSASVVVSSSTNPSVYGQGVTFTATVTPEQGTGTLPLSDTVTFSLDNGAQTQTVNLSGTNSTYSTAVWSPVGPLSVGAHTLVATFNLDGNDVAFGATSNNPAYTQNVLKASVNITPSDSWSPVVGQYPVPGQVVTMSASVSAQAPGSGTPGGNVEFFLDGNLVSSGGSTTFALSGGVASAPLPFLTSGLHRVRITYLGDGNFNGASTTQDFQITVKQGTPTVSITASSNPSPAVYGQTVTLSVSLSDLVPPVTPSGTVTFYDGPITQTDIINSATLSGSNGTATASITTSRLSTGPHTINIVYSGDLSFVPVSTGTPLPGGDVLVPGALSYTINKAGTSTTISLSSDPTGTVGFGQTLKYTATVVAVAPGSGTPTGGVIFYDGDPATTGTPISTTQAMLNGSGVAVLTSNTLGIGAHTIFAKYVGDNNFATSTSLTGDPVTVMVASTVTVTSSPSSTSVFGQAVNFTAAVAAMAPATGHPNAPDTVTFYDGNPASGGTQLGGGAVTLDATGKATLNGVLLTSAGTHTIYAQFSGDVAGTIVYMPSSGTESFKVNPAATTTTATASAASATYGVGFSVTATVAIVAPGAPVNGTGLTGNVTFYDGPPAGKVVLASNVALVGNTAVINASNSTVASLNAGAHTIYAVYGNDADFATSQGTAPITIKVDSSTTTLTYSTGGNPPAGEAFYSVPVTLSATVAANSSGAVPTGTVTFTNNGAAIGTVTLSGGVATLVINNLAVSSTAHALVATYNPATTPATNFTTSKGTNTLTIVADTTNTTVSSSAEPSYVGQAVTFTATVTAGVTGAAVPGGTVQFWDGPAGTGTLLGAGTSIGGGKWTLATSALKFGHGSANPADSNPGGHTITASYLTNTSFTASQGTLSQDVLYNDTIKVTSGLASPTYGQDFTFTATVTAAGTPVPHGIFAGTVTFFDGGHVLATALASANPVTIGGNGTSIIATLANSSLLTPLTAGSHGITVSFTADAVNSDFISKGPSAALTQAVTQDATTTAITTATGNTVSSTYGLAQTFTATVIANSPGSGSPTGKVNFYDGTTLLGFGTLSGGVATFSTSSLIAGTTPHKINATYLGDTNFKTSSSPAAGAVSVTVAQAQTSTTLAATPVTSPQFSDLVYGQSITFVATVTTTTGAGLPVGNVVFSDLLTGGTVLGTVTNAQLVQTGPNTVTATLVVSSLKVTTAGNPHVIVASFVPPTNALGSSNYTTSSSAQNLTNWSVEVDKDTTTVTVSPSSGTIFVNQPIVYTATVSAAGSGSGVPTGTVQFFLDAAVTPFSTAALNTKGVAVSSALAIQTGGPHTITAVYVPASTEANFIAGNPGSLPINVQTQAMSKLVGPGTITGNVVNVPLTFTVTAQDASGNRDYSANGTVKVVLMSGPAAVAGTFTLSGGVATITLTLTKPGTYVLLLDAKDSLGEEATTMLTINATGRQT